MLQFGVSLPALMRLLGHKKIHMSLRYVQVTQQDLQREFHQRVRMPPIRIVCPRSHPHSLKKSRAPASPTSVRQSRPHVIFSRCIVVSSAMRKSVANCSASTNVSSPLPHSYTISKQTENEERLAG